MKMNRKIRKRKKRPSQGFEIIKRHLYPYVVKDFSGIEY